MPTRINSDKLTPKQAAFVTEYLVDKNATQAAKRAGYSEKCAKQQGTENLAKPAIREAIADKLGQVNKKALITAEEVIQGLTDIATGEDVSPGVRVRAYDLLGKYHQLFLDRIKVSGDEDEPIRVEFGIPRPARLRPNDS